MEATAEITAAVKNVPALRFPEFESEWVEGKLKGLIKTIDSGWSPQCEGIPAEPDEWGVLKTTSVVWDGFNENENKRLPDHLEPREEIQVRVNDILITRAGPTNRVGVTVHVNKIRPKLMLSDKIVRLRTNDENNSKFIAISLAGDRAQKQLMSKSSGLATSQTNISQSIILNTKLIYPSKVEQQKIASFISATDAKIQQLSKKKELLEKYKKGVMQQILSQQIRFKDDNGNDYPKWEEKLINDIAPLQRGFDLPVSEIKKGNYPVVFSNGILKSHSEYKAKGPGVVTGRSGTIGQVTFVENDYWPHNTSLWVTNFCGNDPKYVFYFYQQFKLERFGTGSGVPTLNRNDVHVQKVYFPTYPEQVKIRDFFTVLDNKLNYTSKQLEQAQQFKKGLLQQLFV